MRKETKYLIADAARAVAFIVCIGVIVSGFVTGSVYLANFLSTQPLLIRTTASIATAAAIIGVFFVVPIIIIMLATKKNKEGNY